MEIHLIRIKSFTGTLTNGQDYSKSLLLDGHHGLYQMDGHCARGNVIIELCNENRNRKNMWMDSLPTYHNKDSERNTTKGSDS